MTMRSFAASAPVTLTCAARPNTATPDALPASWITSSPLVAFARHAIGRRIADTADRLPD